MKYKYVFGPVPSRRLGLSLGIDLVPFKTCSYNCVFCECGRTTNLTVTRDTFSPPGDVMAELRERLGSRPRLDSITLAGSGEPTLARSLGAVISAVKQEFPEYILSVLTNGSLLKEPDVREELSPADRVIPTLTTASQHTFERIHRPHPSLHVDAVIEGIERFRKEFKGELWLEVFIIPGLNTSEEELAGLGRAIEKIYPDRVQLNTTDRPPAEGWVRAATSTEMDRIRMVLERAGTVIVSEKPSASPLVGVPPGSADLIRVTLRRRPSTVQDLVRTTGLCGAEVAKILTALEHEGEITAQRMDRGIFYRIYREPPDREVSE